MTRRPISWVPSSRLPATDRMTSCARAPGAATSTAERANARIFMNRIIRLLSARSIVIVSAPDDPTRLHAGQGALGAHVQHLERGPADRDLESVRRAQPHDAA